MNLQETYDALTDHLEEEGYIPSIRELGKRLGLKSPDSVRERLLALKEAGWIARGSGARQIRLLGPPGSRPTDTNRGSAPIKALRDGSPEVNGHNHDAE
jgi:SOS-response transcriptional repressor LexA